MLDSTKSSLASTNSGWIPLPSIEPLLKTLIVTALVPLSLFYLLGKKDHRAPSLCVLLPWSFLGQQVRSVSRCTSGNFLGREKRNHQWDMKIPAINDKERPWRSLNACAPLSVSVALKESGGFLENERTVWVISAPETSTLPCTVTVPVVPTNTPTLNPHTSATVANSHFIIEPDRSHLPKVTWLQTGESDPKSTFLNNTPNWLPVITRNWGTQQKFY